MLNIYSDNTSNGGLAMTCVNDPGRWPVKLVKLVSRSCKANIQRINSISLHFP